MAWSSCDTQFVKLAVTFVLLTLAPQQFNGSQTKHTHIDDFTLDCSRSHTARSAISPNRLGHACGTMMHYMMDTVVIVAVVLSMFCIISYYVKRIVHLKLASRETSDQLLRPFLGHVQLAQHATVRVQQLTITTNMQHLT